MGGQKEWMEGAREGQKEGGIEGRRKGGREEKVGSFWLSSKVQSTQAGKGEQQEHKATLSAQSKSRKTPKQVAWLTFFFSLFIQTEITSSMVKLPGHTFTDVCTEMCTSPRWF